MLRLIALRIAWSIPLLFVVSALTFVLVSLVPGNPAQVILGPYASAQQVSQLVHQLGLDQPLSVQYWHWLEHAIRGNFGTSLTTGESVTSLLGSRLGVSLDLIIAGTLVATLVGVLLGVLAASRGGLIGRAVEALAVLGLAVPNFWLGLVMVELLAVTVHIFPATGFVPFSQSPFSWARSLVLPVAAISAAGTTLIAVQTRDSMLEVLRRDFVRVLEANGLPRRSVLYKHALRNAAIPVATVVGIVFVGLLGGSVLVESVFALPGLGSELTSAAQQHDIPVIQGAVVYFTLVVVVVNLIVDVTYGLLDPRVRTRA